MVLYGTTHWVGDGITTAQIIAPEHREIDDPAVLAAECLATVDPHLAEHVRDGDVLLTGHDFGCGDHADRAVLSLQAVGFVALVCASVAPTFEQAATLYGLPILTSAEASNALVPGYVARLDLVRGIIKPHNSDTTFATHPCTPEVIATVQRLQLLRYMRQVVEEEGFDG
ncbi:MAG: hypothetical protein GFH27_549285n275 [Chloroflexi bacterium AL-W]|nr:hypothetical protein [Chloroflexi bacterium AL-N1]NOK65787.1 hypothetical protein [Chloroflexi bacterium AL-N10]NOK74272.1 hypothetical protein [Chloroflexi bacterium AL-N5]NOK80820.1 hypothetical protein [Chloroflexi bacterium AL-W]NOK88530.1 hypothetical protein [Chloroflexi bacterium AL-N15]